MKWLRQAKSVPNRKFKTSLLETLSRPVAGHIEIDRARQENKELQIRLNAATKEHAAAEKLLFQAAEQAKALATDANREAGIERARAGALEAQLAKLQDLPAALEAAMRRSGTPQKQRTLAGKRAAPTSRKRAKVSTD